MRISRRWTIATLCVAHIAALVWVVGDPGRRRMMFFDVAGVSPETLASPPANLLELGYTQDDPRELARFRARAEHAVAGAATDLARIRLLSDAIYSLRRPGRDPLGPFDALTLTSVADALESGADGQCGHRTWMLAGMARSIGLDTRQVVWAKRNGEVGHMSLEFYSRDEQRWIYFDLNLNGYATAGGRALSAADLRARTAGAPAFDIVSNAGMRTWNEAAFRRLHDEHDFDWYLMSNRLQVFERGTRFGRLHAAYGLLTRLPMGGPRIADYLFTGPQTRVAIAGLDGAGPLPPWALRALAVYLLMASALLALVIAVRWRKRSVERRNAAPERLHVLPDPGLL